MSSLLDKRLLLITGKGGVGRSVVASALAVAAARRGKRVLLCEVNTKERCAPLLGHSPVGAELRPLEDNLWAVNVRPDESMREYGLMILKYKAVYDAVFENRVVRYFLRFIPSLSELVMLGKILFHVKEKDSSGRHRFDLVIVDAPATGHAVTFLSVPQVLIDTLPAGPMTSEASWMRDLIVTPSVTGAVVVALPEEMPFNEAIELDRLLQSKVHVPVAAVLLNCAVEQRFDDQEIAELEQHDAALAALARSHRVRASQSQAFEAKLRAAVPAPFLRIPRLHEAEFGRVAIEQVAAHLTPLLEGEAAR